MSSETRDALRKAWGQYKLALTHRDKPMMEICIERIKRLMQEQLDIVQTEFEPREGLTA